MTRFVTGDDRTGYGWAPIDHPCCRCVCFSYDEAAKKVAGDGVIERGSIHKLATKIWDLNGRSRL